MTPDDVIMTSFQYAHYRTIAFGPLKFHCNRIYGTLQKKCLERNMRYCNALPVRKALKKQNKN